MTPNTYKTHTAVILRDCSSDPHIACHLVLEGGAGHNTCLLAAVTLKCGKGAAGGNTYRCDMRDNADSAMLETKLRDMSRLWIRTVASYLCELLDVMAAIRKIPIPADYRQYIEDTINTWAHDAFGDRFGRVVVDVPTVVLEARTDA